MRTGKYEKMRRRMRSGEGIVERSGGGWRGVKRGGYVEGEED